MIGHCQNGASRRSWLQSLPREVFPKMRPGVRRALRAARWLSFWFASVVAAALLAALALMLIADAMRDPLTTMKPTAGTACFKAPRSV